MLGLAAASDHVLQARMTNNLISGSQTSHAANSTLKWGENWLFGLGNSTRPIPCAAECSSNDVIRARDSYGNDIKHKNQAWWEANAWSIGTDPVTGAILDDDLLEQNRSSYWLIEEVHLETVTGEEGIDEMAYYRLWARSPSGQSGVYSVTESIVSRPWGDADLCLSVSEPYPCTRRAWRKVH
jgi:Tfp pilus assembly protein PilX